MLLSTEEWMDLRAFRALRDAGAEYTIDIGGKRRWRAVASLRHPDDPVDERGSGMGRRILFQAVPEAKTVKNRVHLDLLVGPEDHDAEVERVVALGATVVGVHERGPVDAFGRPGRQRVRRLVRRLAGALTYRSPHRRPADPSIPQTGRSVAPARQPREVRRAPSRGRSSQGGPSPDVPPPQRGSPR